MLTAPFNDGQVDELRAYQHSGVVVPLKCPHHQRVLVASAAGLSCDSCSYLQKHCPAFIVTGRWRQYFTQLR